MRNDGTLIEVKLKARLVNFVRFKSHASSVRCGTDIGKGHPRAEHKEYMVRHDLSMAWHHLRNSGPRVTFGKLVGRLRGRA